MKPYVVKYIADTLVEGNMFTSANLHSGEELAHLMEETITEQLQSNYELMEIKDTFKPSASGYSQHTGYLLIFKIISK